MFFELEAIVAVHVGPSFLTDGRPVNPVPLEFLELFAFFAHTVLLGVEVLVFVSSYTLTLITRFRDLSVGVGQVETIAVAVLSKMCIDAVNHCP